MKVKEKAQVLEQIKLAEGVYSLKLKTTAAEYAIPGQFISIYSNNGSKLLPVSARLIKMQVHFA